MRPESDEHEQDDLDLDLDLRALFAAQREAEREQAPAWRPIRATSAGSRRRGLPRLVPASAGVLATAMVAALLLWHSRSQPNLTEALPVLFDAPAQPLFSSLSLGNSSPSDFFLPSHLTIPTP